MTFFSVSTCFSSESIKLAVENSWPPYSDINGNGISKDIIQKAFASVNINVEFIVVPYKRALFLAEVGEVVGAFNVTKQESTTKVFSFGEEAILQAEASFYYENSNKLNVKSANEIPTGASIALIIGYEYGNDYEKNKHRFNEIRVSNQKQIIQLIRNKRVDLAIMFDEVAKYTLREMGLERNDIKQGGINHKSDIYVAFNKNQETTPLIKLLDQGLRNIKAAEK
ncbi:substrate-binding periplasmic protein [Thalassotalea profundi]|nr:transporter substrate-binding domain-containing protein [Thalassotalea profundi]